MILMMHIGKRRHMPQLLLPEKKRKKENNKATCRCTYKLPMDTPQPY